MSDEQTPQKKSLESIFGLPENEQSSPSKDIVTLEGTVEGSIEEVKDEVDQDFDEARDNLKNITDITKTALDDLAHIAKDSEQPRSYDALSKLVGAAVVANKALVEIHKNRKEGKDDGSVPGTINNNLFVTTADFQRRMRELDNGDNEEEES